MTVPAAIGSCGLRVVSESEATLHKLLASMCLTLGILAIASIAWAQGTEIGPTKGSLMLVGGGAPLDDVLIKRVIDLAGGPEEFNRPCSNCWGRGELRRDISGTGAVQAGRREEPATAAHLRPSCG